LAMVSLYKKNAFDQKRALEERKVWNFPNLAEWIRQWVLEQYIRVLAAGDQNRYYLSVLWKDVIDSVCKLIK
jgi:hypothetical protein